MTGYDSMHAGLYLKNVGEKSHSVNFTGYSYNETWSSYRAIDDSAIGLIGRSNETGFDFTFSRWVYAPSWPHYGYAWIDNPYRGFNCSWTQLDCKGSISIETPVQTFLDVHYEYDALEGALLLSYKAKNAEDIGINERIQFGEPSEWYMWIEDLYTGEKIYDKWTRVWLPHSGSILQSNNTEKYEILLNSRDKRQWERKIRYDEKFEQAYYVVHDNMTAYMVNVPDQEDSRTVLVNRTLSIETQAEATTRDGNMRTIYGSEVYSANFTYTQGYDGPIITVMPDKHTMFQLKCTPDWPMFNCSTPVRHDGWLYSYEVEMVTDEYNSTTYEAVLAVVMLNATNFTEHSLNTTKPLAMALHTVSNDRGQFLEIMRNDIFLPLQTSESYVDFEKVYPPMVNRPSSVLDLTGDYVMQQDVRLEGVSHQNHSVAFTGYLDPEQSQWVVNRQIDYHNLTYVVKGSDEGFGLNFFSEELYMKFDDDRNIIFSE